MNDDRITRQIDGLATRRFLGCLGRFLLVFVVAMLVLAVAMRLSVDRASRAAAAFGFGGFVFGFAASILADPSRKLLAKAFVLIPLAAALVLFALRTLFGMSQSLSLALALVPVLLSVGFVVGLRVRMR